MLSPRMELRWGRCYSEVRKDGWGRTKSSGVSCSRQPLSRLPLTSIERRAFETDRREQVREYV